MQEFKVEKKLYFKSDNSVNKIFIRYLYCIVAIYLFFIGNILYRNDYNLLFILFLKTIISFSILSIIEVFFKKNKTNILGYIIENNILVYPLIIGLFTVKEELIISIIVSIIIGIIKNINKKGDVGCLIYGLLLIICYREFILDGNLLFNITNYKDISNSNLIDLLFGLKTYTIAPMLSLFAFIYLFYKKSIKYNIFIYYMFSFSIIMLFYGLFNNLGLTFLIYQLCSQNIIFMCIYLLCDYRSSPITLEGQAIYGTILGIFSSILKFIMPTLSIILPMLLGPLLLTRPIDRLSFSIKYNRKLLNFIVCLMIVLVLLCAILLCIFI